MIKKFFVDVLSINIDTLLDKVNDVKKLHSDNVSFILYNSKTNKQSELGYQGINGSEWYTTKSIKRIYKNLL